MLRRPMLLCHCWCCRRLPQCDRTFDAYCKPGLLLSRNCSADNHYVMCTAGGCVDGAHMDVYGTCKPLPNVRAVRTQLRLRAAMGRGLRALFNYGSILVSLNPSHHAGSMLTRTANIHLV